MSCVSGVSCSWWYSEETQFLVKPKSLTWGEIRHQLGRPTLEIRRVVSWNNNNLSLEHAWWASSLAWWQRRDAGIGEWKHIGNNSHINNDSWILKNAVHSVKVAVMWIRAHHRTAVWSLDWYVALCSCQFTELNKNSIWLLDWNLASGMTGHVTERGITRRLLNLCIRYIYLAYVLTFWICWNSEVLHVLWAGSGNLKIAKSFVFIRPLISWWNCSKDAN